MRYKHTQVGYVTGGVLLAALPLIYFAFMAEDGELGEYGAAMLGAFGILAVLFSGLTVQVTDRKLVFYFGPGFWTRRFALDESPSDDVTVRVLDGLNHLFQPADTGLPTQYAQIDTTMAPRALQAVSSWIRQRTATD